MRINKISITPEGLPIELFFKDSSAPSQLNRTVLALGTFDGVHTAHRALITGARELAGRLSASHTGVWCFEESPAQVLSGDDEALLTTKEEKVSLLLDGGIDFVAMGSFSDFKNLSAEDFIDNVLKKGLGCIGTVSGYDHRFGHKGLGNSETLSNAFGSENTVSVNEIRLGNEKIGSSSIRNHLLLGELELANAMLERKFSVTSRVTEGKRLGRKLGFPTANQPYPIKKAPLKRGVYATLCKIEGGQTYIGVTNVGTRPSISAGDDHILNCETYIVDFSGDVYGKEMKLEFHKFIREEKKFPSLEELTAAISADTEKTVAYFAEKK